MSQRHRKTPRSSQQPKETDSLGAFPNIFRIDAASILAHLPIILLLVIALTQLFRAKVFQQTSWKGGGFGMFASLDNTRFARVFLVQGQQAVPYHHAGEQAYVQSKAVALPSMSNIKCFASEVTQFATIGTDYYSPFVKNKRVGVVVVVYRVGLADDKATMRAYEIARFEQAD